MDNQTVVRSSSTVVFDQFYMLWSLELELWMLPHHPSPHFSGRPTTVNAEAHPYISFLLPCQSDFM
jgi:hypothetical protein